MSLSSTQQIGVQWGAIISFNNEHFATILEDVALNRSLIGILTDRLNYINLIFSLNLTPSRWQ